MRQATFIPKLVLIGLLAFAGAMLLSLGLPKSISAVDATDLQTSTTCEAKTKVSFTGVLSVDAGNYDVYVQLAKRGQKAAITAYGEPVDQSTSCLTIGKSMASGDSWTKIGSWTSSSSDIPAVFQVSSNALGTSLDANRPSLMLISQINPVCVPKQNCSITVDGQSGYVLPAGNFNDQDSLHVTRVSDPSHDKISRVTYYVDDQQVYATKTLEPFDTRYASYYFQKLASVIEYESGQRVVIETKLPSTFSDNPINFIFRAAQQNPLGLILWTIVIVGLATATVIFGIREAKARHRDVRIAHGFEAPQAAKLHRQLLGARGQKVVKRIIAVAATTGGVFAVILLVNTYIVTLFHVDGHSMESTYFTDNQVLVNKIPVTLAALSGREITPERGQVVIMRAVYGIVDPVVADLQKEFIIKRVIGLPRERVVVKDGVITVYNPAHAKGFQPDKGSAWASTMHPNEKVENIDITLGNNELFVSGDNRPESVDSRFNGPITTKQVVGIVTAKLW